MVGIFNCENERAPPNLEMGLLDWNIFRSMQLRATATKKGPKTAAKPSSSSNSNNSSSSSSGSVAATSRRGSVSTPPTTSLSSASSVSTSSSLNTNVQDKSWSFDVTSTGIATYKVLIYSHLVRFYYSLLPGCIRLGCPPVESLSLPYCVPPRRGKAY